MINTELIDSLLSTPEWDEFETKRAACSPGKLLETICAFLNSRGGILAIGLEDQKKAQGKKRIIGIKENLDNIGEFRKLLKSDFNPPVSQHLTFSQEEVINNQKQKDHFLLVFIRKSNDIHSLKNGDTFVRNGNQNSKIGATEITRIRYEKGSLSFEDEISKINDLQQIDLDLLKRYKRDTGSEATNDWQFLKDNGLVKKDNTLYYLTKGGVLLFAKNPSVQLSGKYGIRLSHYYGTKPSFSAKPNLVRRPLTLEGPLLRQIQMAIDYFKEVVVTSSPKLLDGTFQSAMIIPESVYQEAITNAVIHRNYSLQNDIQVRFFDDHIEIESPGTFPAHITVRNIRKERFSRNPLILRTLSRFKESPNLDIGEGVDRMFEVMKKSNLYEPLYFPPSKYPNSVVLHLVNIRRVEYWDTVSHYIDKNGSIDNKKAREITAIPDTLEMTRLLSSWLGSGLVERKGGKTKGAYYIKPGAEISNLFSKVSEK